MAGLFLLNPPPGLTKAKRRRGKRRGAARRRATRRPVVGRQWPRKRRGVKMARKLRNRRPRRLHRKRHGRVRAYARRPGRRSGRRRMSRGLAALLALASRKRRSRRARQHNPAGLFRRRPRRGRFYRRLRGRKRWGGVRYSHPSRRYLRRLPGRRRRSYRRRNPAGFLQAVLSAGTWTTAGGIAVGAIGANVLASRVYGFLPAAVQDENVAMIVRPLLTAAAGLVVGLGVSMLPFKGAKAFGKSASIGGFVAAAMDVLTGVAKKVGFLGYGDYIQLSGQREVEAGQFGDYVQLEGQADVEAGHFDGLGHTAEEAAAANTFGPTF